MVGAGKREAMTIRDYEDHKWIEDENEAWEVWEAGRARTKVRKTPRKALAGIPLGATPGTATGPSIPTVYAVQPQSASSDDESHVYHWAEDDPPYMRIPKELRADLRAGIITPNDYFAFEGISELAYSTLLAWGHTQDEYAEAAQLTKDEFRTCEKHLCRARRLAIEPWKDADGWRDTSVYILFPYCNKYDLADIRAIRPMGSPDDSRPKNAGVDLPIGALK